jgi:hypothetical protein
VQAACKGTTDAAAQLQAAKGLAALLSHVQQHHKATCRRAEVRCAQTHIPVAWNMLSEHLEAIHCHKLYSRQWMMFPASNAVVYICALDLA